MCIWLNYVWFSCEKTLFKYALNFFFNFKIIHYVYLHQLRDWSRGQQHWGSSGSTVVSRASVWSESREESLMRFRGTFCPTRRPWCIGQSQCGPWVYQLQSLMSCMCMPPRHSSWRASQAHSVCPQMTQRMSMSHGSDAHILSLLHAPIIMLIDEKCLLEHSA